MRNIWFQQDGATAHTAKETVNILRSMFAGRVISSFGDVPWPPTSPDLSACDFFLWGYLKSRVYIHKPRSLTELKDAIRGELQLIVREMLGRVFDDFKQRVENCIQEDGRHLQGVTFHN
jgi:hypothetical protein